MTPAYYNYGEAILYTVVAITFSVMILSLIIINVEHGSPVVFYCASIIFAITVGILLFILVKLKHAHGFIRYDKWNHD